MRKSFILVLCVVFLAAAAGCKKEAQKKPYTKEDFGPWSAAIAEKHSPVITYEKAGAGLKVTVKVDSHPMDAAQPHYIMWIKLEDGSGNKLGEKTLKPTDPAPVATFDLATVPKMLMASEECNIHGTWMSHATVEMK